MLQENFELQAPFTILRAIIYSLALGVLDGAASTFIVSTSTIAFEQSVGSPPPPEVERGHDLCAHELPILI